MCATQEPACRFDLMHFQRQSAARGANDGKRDVLLISLLTTALRRSSRAP
jgi:hypothetical protein